MLKVTTAANEQRRRQGSGVQMGSRVRRKRLVATQRDSVMKARHRAVFLDSVCASPSCCVSSLHERTDSPLRLGNGTCCD